MAHELYELSEGRKSIGYVGEVPWHGLGQQIEEDASLEVWAKQAGLDWTIDKKPLLVDLNPEAAAKKQKRNLVEYFDRVALVRSDNGQPLSIMSPRYQIVQPAEILEFYRDLIDTAGFKMDTAGSVFHGKKIWALARIGKGVKIKGDELNGYLLLSTSCDGSLATTAQFTSVRVVCNNTLTMAVDRTNNRYAIKVPHHSKFNAEEVKMELGLANNAWGQFEEEVGALIGRRLRKREAVNVLIRAMGDPELEIDEQPNLRAMAKIIELFSGEGIGADMPTAKGTAWGLLNAATQYADHSRVTRTQDSRLDSAWWGRWEMIKRRVFEECLAKAA